LTEPSLSDLPERVDQAICRHRLLRQGQPLLVAVSGGVDSMVLLDVLSKLSRTRGWQLTVAHLNHQLRGRSSDADERLVRRAAQRMCLPLVVERADVRYFARTTKLSLEMAARRVRHDFLARTAAQAAIRTVALAHHADDQLELFFLRLLRGSGGEGLAGMRWRNPSPSNSEVELVRPLLDLPKAAMRQYASQHHVRFREDATNASLDIQRNRLRHELLPLLRKKYQPTLDRSVLRAMAIIGAETELVTEVARDWLEQMRRSAGKEPQGHRGPDTPSAGKGRRGPLVLRRFEKLPVAVQRRSVQLQLRALGLMPDFDLVERLRSSVGAPVSIPQPEGAARLSPASSASKPGSRSTAYRLDSQDVASAPSYHPWPLAVSRDATGLLKLIDTGTPQFNPRSLEVAIQARAGEEVFDGVKVQWRITPPKPAGRWRRVGGHESFDADRIGWHILLRHWQPGDRFQPIGMDRAVKLQDLFTNAKIPRNRRHQLLVGETTDGEVFWVEDLRISEQFKLRKTTRRCLRWGWQRL
jgi:tRNA(Ile)-lysidine synthase